MSKLVILSLVCGISAASWAGEPDDRAAVTLNSVTVHAASEKVGARVEVIGTVETTVDELKNAWVGYAAKTYPDLKLVFKSESHMEVHALENYCTGAQVGKMDRQLNLTVSGGYLPVGKITGGVPAVISSVVVHYRDSQNRPWQQTLSCAR